MADLARRRIHAMPFGAELLEGGGVRFRLWAPTARQVELCLSLPGRSERLVPMTPQADGWYELVDGHAAAGGRYRYRIDGEHHVPDPASRSQPDDVHGLSRVEAPRQFAWHDGDWRGRPWSETVLYELHVGSFTPEGTFAGVESRLDHLAGLGVTAIQLMPIADFPGRRNWGYDGVLPYAPDAVYGPPAELKQLVQAAHARGLMVFLDVVYNHFGPEGNYLHRSAKPFFTDRHRTPWGEAINFDGPGSANVREFFVHNALYWLEEFHVDGLRLDAVHAIHDASRPGFLEQLARAVGDGPGARRAVHLVLENDRNEARWLRRDAAGHAPLYVAQWNDDVHHALHCLLTGERGGYYADYAEAPGRRLARALAEGFAYQGEPSPYRGGAPRGESSAQLPPLAFVNFLQNHDQVGNRACGERLTTLTAGHKLRAAVAVLLLSPAPPLLFMGEEFGCRQPFPFFCDFGPELAGAVTEGRRREFARFPEFRDPRQRSRIPDPNAPETFAAAVLDWTAVERPEGREWLDYYRVLLDLRRREIVPRLPGLRGGRARWSRLGPGALRVDWVLGDGSRLALLANLGDASLDLVAPPPGEALFATSQVPADRLEPWTASWWLDSGGGARVR